MPPKTSQRAWALVRTSSLIAAPGQQARVTIARGKVEVERFYVEKPERLRVEPIELEAWPLQLFHLVRDDELERFDPEIA